MTETRKQDLKGCPAAGQKSHVEIRSFNRRLCNFKEVDNSLNDIQDYILKEGRVTVHTSLHLEGENVTLGDIENRCQELSQEGVVFVYKSLFPIANIEDQTILELSKGVIFDALFLMKDRAPAVLTVVKDSCRNTDGSEGYNAYLAKKIVSSLRKFTTERVSCIFGVTMAQDWVDSTNFATRMRDIEKRSSKMCTPDSLRMPMSKYKAVVRAFAYSVAATSSVDVTEDSRNTTWFLTLGQFQLLMENIDKKEVTINTYHGSGGNVLSQEVARRLEKYGHTVLVTDNDMTVRKKDVCYRILSVKEVASDLKRLSAIKFDNLIIFSQSDFPSDSLKTLKVERCWTFHYSIEPVLETEGQSETEGQTENKKGLTVETTPPAGSEWSKGKIEKHDPEGLTVETPPPAGSEWSKGKTEKHDPEDYDRLPIRSPMITSPGIDICIPWTANTPLQNIRDSTQILLQQQDDAQYVSTYADRSALKLLIRYGSVFVKGRSGSGKSRIGLSLLDKIAKTTNRIPVFITSPHQWDLLPKYQPHDNRFEEEKYIVLIDDIFGNSNIVESQVDAWEKLFKIMWPSVESGHIFVIFTSRPEIYAQCESRMKKHDLMRKTKVVLLDKGEYCLRDSEKVRLVKVYCGKLIQLDADNIRKIAETKTVIGFPQCCQFFARSKKVQSQGIDFFTKPYEYLKSEINSLKETDVFGYFVLVLVLMHKGCLEKSVLKPFQMPVQFRRLLEGLRECLRLSLIPTQGQIKEKSDLLCGVYLCKTKQGYQFEHQSIFDAVFLNVSNDFPELCISICPTEMLIRFVRTQKHTRRENEVTIFITRENHETLADRITEILLKEESLDILDHPCFHNKEFCQGLVRWWTDNGMLSQIYARSVSTDIIMGVPFEYRSLMSVMILKGIDIVPYLLLTSRHQTKIDMLQELFSCAIFVGSKSLIQHLSKQGVSPNEDCFRALCGSGVKDIALTDKIFTVVKFEEMIDIDKLLCQCVLHGHTHLVKLIIKKMKHLKMENTVYQECLVQLFKSLRSTNTTNPRDKLTTDETEVIVKMLLDTGCKANISYLVWLASSHKTPTALQQVITSPDAKVNTYHGRKTALHQACEFGAAECVMLLLRHGADVNMNTLSVDKYGCPIRIYYTVLHLAAKSQHESAKKVESLISTCNGKKKGKTTQSRLNELVNKQCFNGYTPLHTAVERGNTDSVGVLLMEGANVNMVLDTGDSPLHLAVLNNRKESVKRLLQSNADVNMKNSSSVSPLLIAATKGNSEIVKSLILGGADLKSIDPDHNTALHKAVVSSDMDTMKYLVQKGVNINCQNNQGVTALHMAAQTEDSSIVEFLCLKGADVTLKSNFGQTVVHYAAMSHLETLEKLQYLVKKKYAPLEVDTNRRSPMFQAVQTGDTEVVEFLIDEGLDLEEMDLKGNTLLHAACKKNKANIHMIKMLLDGGVDPSHPGSEGNTALHIALAHQDDVNITRMLAKTCVHKSSEKGKTPLHIAAYNNRHESIKLLLECGAGVNLQDDKGRSALHFASQNRCQKNVSYLSEHGADTCIQDAKGSTSIHIAAGQSDGHILRSLLSYTQQRSKDIKDRTGLTPLHVAVRVGCINNTALLLRERLGPNVQDNAGKTSLHHAAEKEHVDIIKMLLEHGADASIKDKMMRGALHFAVENKGSVVAIILLEKGADPSVQNRQGRTVLHEAAIANRTDIALAVLNSKRYDNALQDNYGKTPLHYAVEKKDFCFVQLLLDFGFDVNVQDVQGLTLLHYAAKINDLEGTDSIFRFHFPQARKYQIEIVKSLIKHGATLNVGDKTGKTPLHYAALEGNMDIVETLIKCGADDEMKDDQSRTALDFAIATDTKHVECFLSKIRKQRLRQGKRNMRKRKAGYDQVLTALGRTTTQLKRAKCVSREGISEETCDDQHIQKSDLPRRPRTRSFCKRQKLE